MTDSTNKEPLTSSLKDDFDPKWEGPATRLDIKTLVFRLQETFDKSDQRDSNTSMRIENIDLTIEAIQQSIIKFDTKIDRIETNLLSEMKHLDAKLTTQSDTLDFKLTTQTDTHETRLTAKMVNLEEKLVGQMNDLGKNMQVQFDALKEFFGLRFEHLSLEIANLKNRADNVDAKIAQLQRSGRLNRVLLLITAISPFVLALVNR
jgi:hypothetical protein